MKIESLYSQGTDTRREDFSIDFPSKVLGAIDTGSGVFHGPQGPQIFHGMTGGQYLGTSILGMMDAYLVATDKPDPEEILEAINSGLCELFSHEDIDVEDPAVMPFASYALVFFNKNTIKIVQGGDCQIIWKNRDGTFGWTENQTLEYDGENLRIIADLMKKHNGDRSAMWQKFNPILKERRQEYFNSPIGKFSLLNGQPEFSQHWQRVTLKVRDIETMIIFTDGFVTQKDTADMAELTRKIIHICEIEGMQAWLNKTRESAAKNAGLTHVTLPEATATMIKF